MFTILFLQLPLTRVLFSLPPRRSSYLFLTRTTAVLATVFFLTSLTLAYFSTQASTSSSVVDSTEAAPMQMVEPATDAPVVPNDVPMVPDVPVESPVSDLPPE